MDLHNASLQSMQVFWLHHFFLPVNLLKTENSVCISTLTLNMQLHSGVYLIFLVNRSARWACNKKKLSALVYTYKPSSWITITALKILTSQPDL